MQGLTVRGVAERLGGRRRSREQRIKEHLAILTLPEDLRARVAAGGIPLLAVKTLVGLCGIHEELARAAVTAAEPGNGYEEAYSWSEIVESPLAIAVNCCEPLPPGVFPTRNVFSLEAFTLSEKTKTDLAAYRDLTGRELDGIRFTAEQVQQAKALGAVHDAGWFQVIVGADVADRLAEDEIAQALKDARARASTVDANRRGLAGDANRHEPGDDGAVERLGEQAAEDRERQSEQRDRAVAFNLELGVLALKHLTRVKVDERVLRILASVDVGGQLRGLASRGARLCLPGWVTQTEQKNGRTKTTYLEGEEAHQKAVEFLDGAEHAAQIAGRALVLVALAALADEDALAPTRRSFHTLTFRGPWAGQAERDLYAILRERIKQGQLPALDQALANQEDPF